MCVSLVHLWVGLWAFPVGAPAPMFHVERGVLLRRTSWRGIAGAAGPHSFPSSPCHCCISTSYIVSAQWLHVEWRNVIIPSKVWGDIFSSSEAQCRFRNFAGRSSDLWACRKFSKRWPLKIGRIINEFFPFFPLCRVRNTGPLCFFSKRFFLWCSKLFLAPASPGADISYTPCRMTSVSKSLTWPCLSSQYVGKASDIS